MPVLADHIFETQRPGTDPRLATTCARIGCAKMESVHVPSPHIERDQEDEERIQTYAASLSPGLRSPGSAFYLARSRALTGPITDADSRDNAREVREEVADAINYATWQVQKLERNGGSEASKMLWNGVIIKAVELWDAVVAAEHPEG